MKLTEQLQEWNENDEYQKNIDAIEGMPVEERTPELISELARATIILQVRLFLILSSLSGRKRQRAGAYLKRAKPVFAH